MKLLKLQLFVLFLTNNTALFSEVQLSRALLCVKNTTASNATFANFVTSYSAEVTLTPNEIYARYVNPFYFGPNSFYDYIYLYFKPTASSTFFEKQFSAPTSYGTFKNAEEFAKTTGNQFDLYACSIQNLSSPGTADCNITNNVTFSGSQTPQQICNSASYP